MSLPDRSALRLVLETLLGRDVEVAHGVPVPPPGAVRGPGPVTAAYEDDGGLLTTVALLDLPLAASLGAALALVPRQVADGAAEDGDLPPDLRADADEVLNVLAAPVVAASGVHQRLACTWGPGQAPPAAVQRAATLPGPRLDLRLSPRGYGSGLLSLVQVRPPPAAGRGGPAGGGVLLDGPGSA